MTITSSYSAGTVISPIVLPNAGSATNLAGEVTGLSNGGFATVSQDTEGYADLTIYGASGNVIATNTDFRAFDTQITQLANGNILVCGSTNDGVVEYRIFNQQGLAVGAGGVGRSTAPQSNASVIATAGGGFAVGYQLASGAGNNDILFTVRDATGGLVFTARVDTLTTDNDQDLSAAQLADGGYALAWDRTDPNDSSKTQIWYEILNADGSIRMDRTLFDDSGSIERQPNVTALAGGGFTIAYENNLYTGTSDISEYELNATGAPLSGARLSAMPGADSQVAQARLTDGIVVTTFTDVLTATDTDIALSAVIPSTTAGNLIVNGLTLPGASSTHLESNASVSALGNNMFAVSFSYTDNSGTNAQVGVYQLVHNMTGDAGDNAIAGDDLSDSIQGGDGNDTITAGTNLNNAFIGGAGYDTVIFSGPRSGYFFSHVGVAGTVLGPDGSHNQISGVEKLQFSDQSAFFAAAPRDLSGDGYSDMVLQSTTGAVRVWTINHDGTLNTNTQVSPTPAASWHAVATGQFNFATDTHADILLQNDNGAMTIWEMNGATVAATASLGALSNVWKAVTTGDFNGDGNADILLQNTSTGQLNIWLMNGTTATTKATTGSAIGTAWHAIATGDFNGDGKSDIVLQNSSGLVAIWLMNGAGVASSASLGGTTGAGWTVRGAGDFNGDGKADLILENAAGSLAIWTMNGASVTAKTGIGSVASSFLVTGTGDFNGDGKADIVFQNSNGAVSEWLMNGATVLTKLNLGNPGAALHMVAGTGG